MDHRGTASVRIEFNLDADPIEGRLHAANADGLAFCGWIELTRAIELGLAAARRARPPAETSGCDAEKISRRCRCASRAGAEESAP
jgi:hypothetical protein